jgi:hypothetical protein
LNINNKITSWIQVVSATVYDSPIVASWINLAIRVLTSLITIPFVLSYLSVEEINVWFLFTTVVTISQSVVFGFNTTFTRYLSYSYSGLKIRDFRKIHAKFEKSQNSNVDFKEFSSLFIVLKRVFLVVGLIYFLLLISAGTYAVNKPIEAMSKSIDGWIAWSIIVVTTTFILIHNYYQIYIEGINQVIKIQTLAAKLAIMNFVVILIVLLLNPTLINIIAAYQSLGLLNLLFMMRLAKKVNNSLLTRLPKMSFQKKIFKVVFETAWKSGVTTVIATTIKHISGVLVSNLMSPTQSAPFLFTKRIFEIIDQFTMAVFKAMIPRMALLRGQGDFKVFIPLVRTLFYLAYGTFIISYLSFIIFGNKLLPLIKSNIMLGSIELIIAFSFAHFISRWGGMIGLITNQSNNILEHIAVIFYSSSFFIFIYLFYSELQEMVFPLATITGVTFASIMTFRRAYKTFNTTFWNFERRVMFPVLILLIIINITYYLNMV